MSEDSLPVELYGTVIGHLYRVNDQPAIEMGSRRTQPLG